MSTVRMIPEEEAVARVKEVYDEIKDQLGIDFVPNLYRVMARKPEYLEAGWNKVKAVVDLFSGFNKLMDGLQVEPDEKPWYG